MIATADGAATMPLDSLLRIATVAKLLDVDSKTIRKWVREGKFPVPLDNNGLWRWREIDVQNYVEGLRKVKVGRETGKIVDSRK